MNTKGILSDEKEKVKVCATICNARRRVDTQRPKACRYVFAMLKPDMFSLRSNSIYFSLYSKFDKLPAATREGAGEWPICFRGNERAYILYEVSFAVMTEAMSLRLIEPHLFLKSLYVFSFIFPFLKINSSQYSVSEHSFNDISSLLIKSALLCAYFAS